MADSVLLGLQVRELLPGEVVFQVTPDRSIGFSSGQSGGSHTHRTCSGQRRRWAVCAPLLSKSKMFKLSGNAWPKASRKS